MGYGPATVMLALLESILPQVVQTALSALQSVVGLSAMVTAPAPVGCTVSSHLLLGAVLSPSVRRTLVMSPFVSVRTLSRTFTNPRAGSTLK